MMLANKDVLDSMSKGIYCLIDLDVCKTPESSVDIGSTSPSSICETSLPFPRTVSVDIAQGQKYRATIVIVVSRQFENVLVEQNHCQGLKRVIQNYTN